MNTTSESRWQLRLLIVLGLPETEHKCISYKVVATVVSPSSFTDPRNGGCPCGLQYPLKITERACHAIKVRRVENFVNQMSVNTWYTQDCIRLCRFQVSNSCAELIVSYGKHYQGLNCRYGEWWHPFGLALFWRRARWTKPRRRNHLARVQAVLILGMLYQQFGSEWSHPRNIGPHQP